jgi:hypothetical protein
MEDSKKSPTQVAAYNAGLELLRGLKAEQESKHEEAPSVAYVLPTGGFNLNKASLN